MTIKRKIQAFTEKYKFATAVVVLIIVQIGFGTYPVIIDSFKGLDPLVFSFFRDTFAFPVLMLGGLLLDGTHVRPQKKHILLFFFLGLTGMFGNQVLYIYGLKYSSPTIASIFQPMIPVLTVAFGLITRIEAFNFRDFKDWAKLWGIMCCGGGAVVMVMSDEASGGHSSDFIGYLLLLGNTSSMAIYILLQKKYMYTKDEAGRDIKLYPPLTATAYIYFMGALLMGIATAIYAAVVTRQFIEALQLRMIYPLIYAVLITSTLCYALITYANTLTSATVVTAFWPLQVPIAAVESYLFLPDSKPITWVQGIGALFIIIGLLAVCYTKYEQEKEEKKRRRRVDEINS